MSPCFSPPVTVAGKDVTGKDVTGNDVLSGNECSLGRLAPNHTFDAQAAAVPSTLACFFEFKGKVKGSLCLGGPGLTVQVCGDPRFLEQRRDCAKDGTVERSHGVSARL